MVDGERSGDGGGRVEGAKGRGTRREREEKEARAARSGASFSLGKFACAFFHKRLTFEAVTGSETPPSDDRPGLDEREVARRREALLAQARGEGPSPGEGGQRLMGLGVQFVVAILLFLYLGMWLDRKFGTAPWCMLAGTFVGAGGGFYSLYRAMVEENRRQDAEEQRRK